MGRRKDLTNDQVKHVRANQMRRCSEILTRVAKFANGELETDLTMAQLKAAQIIKDTCLPALQSTEWQDVTEDMGRPEDIEEQYQQAVKEHARQEAKEMLNNMTREQIAELTQGQPLDS